MAGNKSSGRSLLVFAKVAVVAALAWFVVSFAKGLDLEELARVLRASGTSVTIVLVPPLLALLIETLGWNHVLALVGTKVRFGRLFLIRAATESLATFLPGGALLGESVKPKLLEREGVPFAVGIGAVAHRKYLRVIAHGIFIVASALFGYGVLERFSIETVGVHGLSAVLGLLGCVLATLVGLAGMGLAKGSYASLCLKWFRRSFPRLAGEKRTLEGTLGATDAAARRFFSLPRRDTALSLGACFLAWVLEGSEAFVLLRVLGQDVSFTSVLALDTGVGLVRQAAIFLPGGMLVQEVGYLAVLPFLGISDPVHVGAAFVLLKRARELVTGVGFSLFFFEAKAVVADPNKQERSMRTKVFS